MSVIQGKVVIHSRACELESIKFHAKILQKAAKESKKKKKIIRDIKLESLEFWSKKASVHNY